MSYDDLPKSELVARLLSAEERISVLVDHVADAEQRLAASGRLEAAALALWGHLAPRYVQLHDSVGVIPITILEGVARDCWNAARVFERAIPGRTPPLPTKES